MGLSKCSGWSSGRQLFFCLIIIIIVMRHSILWSLRLVNVKKRVGSCCMVVLLRQGEHEEEEEASPMSKKLLGYHPEVVVDGKAERVAHSGSGNFL